MILVMAEFDYTKGGRDVKVKEEKRWDGGV
jgi:hypothetical protein